MTDIPMNEATTLMRESAAEKAALLEAARATGAGKVTFVSLNIGADSLTFRLTVNSVCAEPAITNVGPVDLYQRVVTGRATVSEIGGILRAGLKGAPRSDDRPFKIGPVIDRIMDDYPFSTAVQAAEAVLAAWLVGVAPPKAGA